MNEKLPTLHQAIGQVILDRMEAMGHVKKAAAASLNINIDTLNTKLRQYGYTAPEKNPCKK